MSSLVDESMATPDSDMSDIIEQFNNMLADKGHQLRVEEVHFVSKELDDELLADAKKSNKTCGYCCRRTASGRRVCSRCCYA